MKADLPSNESDRLDALRRYEVLDTECETSFDRMTALACYICKTPIAAISLVDEDRQWFKAISGLDAKETSRDVAFCAHAILQSDAFVVPDATRDPRFHDNALVTSAPDIRFYAGIPLVTSDGFALGTLCVIDRTPRDLDAEQLNALKTLADQTMTQLELRLSVKKTKHYLDALRLAEMVYSNSSDGMMVSDEDNRVIAINPAFTKLTGYGQDDIVGKNPSLLKSGRQDADFYRQMWDDITTRGCWRGEIWNRRKNGDVFAEWLTINAIPNAEGKPFRYVALFSDITERKMIEDQVRSQRAELLRSNTELEQFAYVASHDLRQPLRTINSYVSLLEKTLETKLDDTARKYLHFASLGAKRMDRLIVDLLEYSRIGRDERPVALIDLSEIAGDAIRDLSGAIADAQGRVAITGPLPEVVGNRNELTRLFQNLIGNALKYHAPDRAPCVTIGAEREGEHWVVTFADNGIGIEPEYFERIFGVFQRLHAPTEYEGTGIGLAVCKKIAEHHGGHITLDSVPGEGSRFHVTFPALG